MWKIQLAIAIHFISSKNKDEERVMHSKSDNIKVMINHNGDEVVEKRFKLLLNRYQIALEALVWGSDFIFECVHLLYHKSRKKKFAQGGSYIDSLDWTKS